MLQGYFLVILILNWLVADETVSVVAQEEQWRIHVQDGSGWTVLTGSKFPATSCIVKLRLELGTDRKKNQHLAFSQENAGYTLQQKMRESDLQVTGL